MRHLGLLALAMVAAVPLVWADDEATKKELEKLQGSWQATAITDKGQEAPEESAKQIKLVITGDEYAELIQGQEIEKGKLKIDSTQQPKTIDLDIKSGKSKGFRQPGFYELDGDTLTFCLAQPGSGKRPAKLESTAANAAMVFVFKKVK